VAAAPEAKELWKAMLEYNAHLNQAFAKIFVYASSTSIVLWSVSIVRSRVLAAGVGVYGLVLGAVTMLALASGHVRLDVHGMGAVVLGQALWYIAAGVALWRLERVRSR
jgi:hypothetical protein